MASVSSILATLLAPTRGDQDASDCHNESDESDRVSIIEYPRASGQVVYTIQAGIALGKSN